MASETDCAVCSWFHRHNALVSACPCVSVPDAKRQRQREDCHSVHKTDHTSHLAALKPTATREREENPAVPACQRSLPARWEAGSTWQMPLGSINPRGLKRSSTKREASEAGGDWNTKWKKIKMWSQIANSKWNMCLFVSILLLFHCAETSHGAEIKRNAGELTYFYNIVNVELQI